MIQASDADRARELLTRARRILCLCHRNPDGDAVGALLGAGLIFEAVFPDTPVLLTCRDPVPETFHFLPGALRVMELPSLQEGDVVVVVDTAEPKLTDYHVSHPALFNGTATSIVVDHHPGNPQYGTVNFIDPVASSSCEIIARLADALRWPISGDTATCLLTGMYTDTGGLLHSNTSADAYRMAARLLRAGARLQMIVHAVYRTAKLSTLKLWGRVLENIQITEEGGAIAAVRESDFRATGADYSELTGAIDYVNAVPGMRFSLILSERGGQVKGSLRTLRDDVDVAKMAGKLLGGGHRKAAGFSVKGTLRPEVRWKVVDEHAKIDPDAQDEMGEGSQ